MKGRLVNYRCATHGVFQLRIVCGYKRGPAPAMKYCPECNELANRNNSKRQPSAVSVSAAVFASITAAARKLGISRRTLVERATEGVGR